MAPTGEAMTDCDPDEKWVVNCSLPFIVVAKLDVLRKMSRRYHNRTHMIGQILWDAVEAYEQQYGEIEIDRDDYED